MVFPVSRRRASFRLKRSRFFWVLNRPRFVLRGTCWWLISAGIGEFYLYSGRNMVLSPVSIEPNIVNEPSWACWRSHALERRFGSWIGSGKPVGGIRLRMKLERYGWHGPFEWNSALIQAQPNVWNRSDADTGQTVTKACIRGFCSSFEIASLPT